MQMPAPGEFFQGKYKIIEVLGKGGFAHVYRALDVEVGRDVAIKVLSPHGEGYTDQVESRFMREARVIASLQDPHTITMFEFGNTASGLLFMVFEYVKGTDLSDVLAQHRRLPPDVVQHILRQLLSALNEAHQNGVLHRDIKPPNIIVFQYMDDPWRVKLIDFGIAKPMNTPTRDMTKLTQEGAVVGTPRYMAPEQFYGEELSERTDIYALGLVAHEMLVGEPAIVGSTNETLLRAALSVLPIRLPAIPGAETLCRVIDRMTERDAKSRFGTATAVVAALDAPEHAPVVGVAGRPMPPSPSRDMLIPAGSSSSGTVVTRPLWMVSGAAAAGLLLVAALGFLLVRRGQPPPAQPAQRRMVPNDLVRPSAAKVMPPAPAPSSRSENDAGGEAEVDVSGCGKDPGWRGTKARTLHLGSLSTRRYWVHLPANYRPDKPHPVVLVFHNAMKTGQNVIQGTEFDRIADRFGVILVAPDSLDAARPWFGDDDLEVTRQAIHETAALACVDPQRLYALGHGGGGNFAVGLRCETPLSAVAISSSGEYETEQICVGDPTPVLRFYGDKDRHVPAAGGEGCVNKTPFRSATEIDRLWGERNRVEGKGETWIKESGGTCTLWRGGAPYVSCKLDGGHDWPNDEAKLEFPHCKEPPPDFPMAKAAWRFFSEHGRALAPAPEETEEPIDE